MKTTLPADAGHFTAQLDALAKAAIDAIPMSADHDDLSFGPLAGISKAMRALETAEGLTLEAAARLILSGDPRYLVAQPGAQFPLPPDLVSRHGSRAQMRSCYAPDLIVLDTSRDHLVIAEFKRSGSSLNNGEISTVRAKLQAVAPLVSSELERAGNSLSIRAVDLALVDRSGGDRRSTLVDLDLLGELLNHDEFAPLMLHFRQRFGVHAQAALRSTFRLQLLDREPEIAEVAAPLEPLIRFYQRPSHPAGGLR